MFKKLFRKFICWAQSDTVVSNKGDYISSTFDSSHGTNFKIFNAVGGKIVSINYYNEALDRNISSLYIIGDREDFAKELSHIITIDSLSK